MREVVLLSAMGGVTRASGRSIARQAGLRKRYDVLIKLRGTYTGRLKKSATWEPRWFDPVEAIDAAKRLGISNLSDFTAGVGSTPSPLAELRAVRNFVAHRGMLSAGSLKGFIHPSLVDVGAYIVDIVPGGVTRFRSWTIDLEGMSRAAVE